MGSVWFGLVWFGLVGLVGFVGWGLLGLFDEVCLVAFGLIDFGQVLVWVEFDLVWMFGFDRV